jgi:3-methyladenine DNA glycosylase AlkD
MEGHRQLVSQPATAREFTEKLNALGPRPGMGKIFALAKDHVSMAPDEILTLLESPDHAARVGAVSIMDFEARSRKTSADRRQALFDLYIDHHDLIDTWDLVDRAAIWVIGDFLVDKPRDDLYRLARSDKPMERRTAILSTFAFIRRGDLDDALRIAEKPVSDDEDLVHKAVGWMLREVGKKDEARLRTFLDTHAASMPRVMLRYSIEMLDSALRGRYLATRARI